MMMASFEEWKKENSMEYKGYTIAHGSIEKNGEAVCVFYHPLGALKEDVFKTGVEYIDALLLHSDATK